MEPTIEELNDSLHKLMSEPDPPPRLHARETAPEIKTPLAASVRDAAMHVIEKRNNAHEWQNGQLSSKEVFDDRNGGVSQSINGLEISVFQRQDSSVCVEIFDAGYCDATMHQNIPDNHFEFTLLDTNSRGETVAFLPDHSIYERMGVTKDEFAHLVTERLSQMANNIDLQSSVQQENTVAISAVQVANESSEVNLPAQASPSIAPKSEQLESVPANSVSVASTNTWIESLKSQIDNVDGAKLQVFSGNNKVYEQTDNVVTVDKSATHLGEKVQQALENPNELKGSVRILVDGEKVYHAKAGQVLENKHSLTLENSPVAPEITQVAEVQTQNLSVAPEITQVAEVQTQNLSVAPEKSLEAPPELRQVAQVQEQNLPVPQEKTLEAPLEVRQVTQVQEQVLQAGRTQRLEPVVSHVPKVVEIQKSNSESIVLPRQDKEIIAFPINPTPLQLDEKMPEVVTPNNVKVRSSLEQELASANARINLLQAQLKDTQKSLEDLSKFVRNDNLKSWAENKVQGISKTSQSIAQQAKTKVMQWVQTKTVQVKCAVHDKISEVKSVAKDKASEVKSAAQNKVTEVRTAAQLKGIEIKESVREQANKFLAPVNSAEVERAAKYIVREYGDGKSYNKAATHSFQLNDKNELYVARQADGAVIYQKGELTKAASSHDILKLNALPNVVNQIKVTQMQSQQKQQVEVGG